MSTVSELLPEYRPTFAEVDLRAFDRNVAAIGQRIPAASRMVAVLKADAYGHGAVELARRCEATVEAFAVALLEEAVELRAAGIAKPILLLGPMRGVQFDLALRHAVTPCVVGPEELDELLARVRANGWAGEIHLKLDTGMGRMGFRAEELDEMAARLQAAPDVRIGGLYTHFANASDPRDPFTTVQIERFRALTARLRELGISAPLHHTANSAAIMRGLVEPGDWVRAGIALYGAEPMDVGQERLEPVLRWTARIARLKWILEGEPVGYGCTWRAPRRSLIATVTAGYADGYPRRLGGQAEVLVRGRRAPVVGRISMDLITLDVTGLEEVAAGDEVTLVGRDATGAEVPAEELAAKLGTISYEIFCGIGSRVPRVYRDGGELRLSSKFERVMQPGYNPASKP